MDLRKEDLPATLQAFELIDNKEIFLAEQVVNTQSEIDTFTSRYSGKLIKAKAVVPLDKRSSYASTATQRRTRPGTIIAVIVFIIIVALVVYGYSTGWLQEQLHLKN